MLDSIFAAPAAVILGLVTNLIWRRAGPKTDSWTPAGIGIVIAAAIIGIGAVDHFRDEKPLSDSTAQRTPSRPPETSPSDDASSQEPADPSPSAQASPTEETAMATSLVDLPSVAQDTNDNIDLTAAGTIDANGTTYGQASSTNALPIATAARRKS